MPEDCPFFFGPWSKREVDIVTKAIRDFEVRNPYLPPLSLRASWTCGLYPLASGSIYVALRYGLGQPLAARSLDGLLQEMHGGGEEAPERTQAAMSCQADDDLQASA